MHSRLVRTAAMGVGCGFLFGGAALGQETTEAAGPALNPGATAWMLASSALVLLMTPGLAMFYGGLVRSKNVLSTMMHSFFCMALVSILWLLFGYGIAFGDTTNGYFGNPLSKLLLLDVSWETVNDYGIPEYVFFCFQMMFAVITPALISGAFAERIRFAGFAVFTGLWLLLVYCPIAHWVWGGGLLSDQPVSWLNALGLPPARDFAGGTVVHISSGVSALIFAVLLGRRRGYPEQPMMPHNLPIACLGAGLLWFGWFGFNGGSGLGSDNLAGLAFTVTHICAAAGAFSWALVEWLHRGKASILGVITGLVAGLVCITPASGFVLPWAALVMGLIVGPVCYFFVAIVKSKLGYDDSLDAFGVHGVGGTVGALLTGVFISSTIGEGYEAGGAQFSSQLISVALTIAYAAVLTAILFTAIDKTVGMRATEEEELTGLDVTQHGEAGYNL